MARNEKVLRLFVVVLATLCVIAFTPLMTSAQVSAKSKLTVDPSVTVVAGSTASVTAKGLSAKKLKKLTWTSKNAKIATVVTKKGKTKIYQTNKQFPILKELQSIVIKSQKGSKPSKTIG